MLDLHDLMRVKHYAKRSIATYCREMQFLFGYYPDKNPADITQQDIIDYLVYIKKTFNVSRAKCRLAAAAFGYFFRNVLNAPYINPTAFYPRKEYKLPVVMDMEEVQHLLSSISSPKNKAIVGLLYGSGIRLGELRSLKMSDIDSKGHQIKVVGGKGSKDRFTLLPKALLTELRAYYLQSKPTVYLFEGQTKGKPMNERSIQHAIRQSMQGAGYGDKGYSAHTLRHSFATHLLDMGSDLHTIKELLGHSKIETTMVYLHLQKKKRAALVSPYDMLNGNGS